ncbi:glycoside hydrolase family 3 N-terminal domain-containing protein [Neobacillus cucumis]|uniref:glycoside hydrolase family 3 N-terminal domain-containing protein n=1 Tax=Neobacillus cucumis TaxID=1740721 RepID=UPI002E238F06|nr:glycoside hydrolase family 3 N-terminal domain-containing protein [Neobacillus cucumis]MED4224490.1 glycoside hydrolase family 3 N-terminal domain-containing protein [Neobacillus cucumis]
MKYKDNSLPIGDRVLDLMSHMTLEEKIAQLCSDLPASLLNDDHTVDIDQLKDNFSNGLGRITQFSILGLQSTKDIVEIGNDIQKFFVEETRLGIPVIFQAENLSGIPVKGGSIFPAMINVASTFNPALAEKMSEIIADETRAVGVRHALSPVLDIAREPRWGRVYETFGEDQYLISQMGKAYVKGMQKEKVNGVIATGKHFLGYSVTQAGLNVAATSVTPKELYEVYATPFEAAIKDAGLTSIMASYSEIDGLPVGANPQILRKLLRETMGFKDVILSDGGAIWKFFNHFRIAKTYKEAGLLGIKGGLDTEMPIGNAYKLLPEYIAEGKLDEELITQAVYRVLYSKFQYGLFEDPYTEYTSNVFYNKAHFDYSRKITDESIILLKNSDNVLPISNRATKIALVGPHADTLKNHMSGYTYPSYIEMFFNNKEETEEDVTFHGIMDEVQKANIENQATETTTKEDPFAKLLNFYKNSSEKTINLETLLKETFEANTLYEELSKQYSVDYVKGCEINSSDESEFDKAIKLAKQKDLIIFATGGNCGWTNSTGGEGKDRASLDLPGNQQKLLDQLMELNKPIILIIFGAGPYSIKRAANNENVKGILQSWLPGAFGSQSLVKILSGELNPSGKLPMTVPQSVGQVPIFYNHKMGSGYDTNNDEALEIFAGGYVDEESEPLYCFGHGISYSDIKIKDSTVGSQNVDSNDSIKVSVTLQNDSDIKGSEVVQIYYRFNDAHVTRPVKQLVAFQKVELDSREEKQILFEISCRQLGYYDENMDFVVEPGSADIMVGTSSKNIVAKHQINITGNKLNVLGNRVYSSKNTIRSNSLQN